LQCVPKTNRIAKPNPKRDSQKQPTRTKKANQPQKPNSESPPCFQHVSGRDALEQELYQILHYEGFHFGSLDGEGCRTHLIYFIDS